jgi:hypothetical protein
MQDDRNKGPGDMISMKDSFNLLMFLARCYAMVFIPFLRRGLGREAIGLYGIGAFLALLFMAVGDPVGFWFLAAWFCTVIYRRIETMRAWYRGYRPHSQYWGEAWFSRLFFKNEKMIPTMEAAACLVAGAALMPLSVSVGSFVFYGFIGIGMVSCFDSYYMQQRLQRMHDAEIENRYMRDLYRR